jgi:pimeloyl-ACP methyl ester carboxylesterase
MTDTYVTSVTKYIDAEGIRYAYRRFGRETGVPLILFQNFRQGMDNVDPLLLNGFARDRPVILFDNAGVASSSGETPDTIEAMADQAAAFVGALKLTELDVLGFSIGGYSAQAFVLRHPHLVRRLMLVGTAPRAQEPRTDPHVDQVVSRPVLGLEEHLSCCSRRRRRPKAPVGTFGIDNKPPGNSGVSAGWISTLRPRHRPQRLNTRQSLSGVRPKASVSRSSRRSSSPRSS